MRDKLDVTVGNHASQMTPETLTSQNRAIICSVSYVLPVPAMEEAFMDCVEFFYKEGKGGENFRKKNMFGCKLVKKEERNLQKLKDMKAVHDIHKINTFNG